MDQVHPSLDDPAYHLAFVADFAVANAAEGVNSYCTDWGSCDGSMNGDWRRKGCIVDSDIVAVATATASAAVTDIVAVVGDEDRDRDVGRRIARKCA